MSAHKFKVLEHRDTIDRYAGQCLDHLAADYEMISAAFYPSGPTATVAEVAEVAEAVEKLQKEQLAINLKMAQDMTAAEQRIADLERTLTDLVNRLAPNDETYANYQAMRWVWHKYPRKQLEDQG